MKLSNLLLVALHKPETVSPWYLETGLRAGLVSGPLISSMLESVPVRHRDPLEEHKAVDCFHTCYAGCPLHPHPLQSPRNSCRAASGACGQQGCSSRQTCLITALLLPFSAPADFILAASHLPKEQNEKAE